MHAINHVLLRHSCS